MMQPENVMLEELLEIFRRLSEAVDAEKFAHQADISAPGEPHLFRAVMEIELFGKGLRECRRAGPARVNERAVDIKQNESHHPKNLPELEMFREVFCGIPSIKPHSDAPFGLHDSPQA
jgi:hypothetical protein